MERRCETVKEVHTCIILHLFAIVTIGYQQTYYMGYCDHGLSHSFNIAVGHCDWAIRGFNQAVNGFVDDGWAATVSDGMDDVSVMINESPTTKSSQISSERFLCTLGGGILCAKASMLLQV
jgi:hypothetical protein